MTNYQINFFNELWQTAVNLRGTVAPAEYEARNVFITPSEAHWDTTLRHSRDDDIATRMDAAIRVLEESHPRLQGLL
jgi:hypothetical protein